MGFGVSGATAVVVVGLFVSAGIFYDAAATSYEAVDEAKDGRAEELLEQRNTAIEVTNASVDQSGTGPLNVTAVNTGTTSVPVSETTLLMDNVVVPHDANATWGVEGDTTTDVWLPGETLTVTVSRSYVDETLGAGMDPERVKFATGNGVGSAAPLSAFAAALVVTNASAGLLGLDDLVVEANNTGNLTLEVAKTDLYVNDQLVAHEDVNWSVAGDPNATEWAPNETLVAEVDRTILEALLDLDVSVDEVRLTSENGASDTEVL